MKKAVSLLAVLAATVLFSGCGGCCGSKKEESNKKTEHSKKDKPEKKEKKHSDKKRSDKKRVEKKSKKPVKKTSEYNKLKKDADSAMKDL